MKDPRDVPTLIQGGMTMRSGVRKANHLGFTMIEMMFVVVIVAVLASIAIPLYGRYIRHGRTTEATAKIGEIITAAKSYAIGNPDTSGNPTWPPAAGAGVVSLTSTPLFSYAITAGASADATTTALTVTATGISGLKMEGVTVAVTVPHINANGITIVDLSASGGGGGDGDGVEGSGGGGDDGDDGDGGDDGDDGDDDHGGGNGGDHGDGHGNGHGHGHDDD
jgi:prepilin-type N-terminal cleavage/methylation domain-containing protein